MYNFLAFLHSLSAVLMFNQRQGVVAVPENQMDVSFIIQKGRGIGVCDDEAEGRGIATIPRPLCI